MRKATTASAKPTSKGKTAKAAAFANPVDEYLAAVPEPAHTTLQKLRATIRSVMPAEAVEGLSYGMPSFRDKKAGMLVAYAAFTEHCSFFPTPGAMDPFEEELKRYRSSKGTIQFPLNKPLAAALVKKIVKERLRLVEAKAAARKKKR